MIIFVTCMVTREDEKAGFRPPLVLCASVLNLAGLHTVFCLCLKLWVRFMLLKALVHIPVI